MPSRSSTLHALTLHALTLPAILALSTLNSQTLNSATVTGNLTDISLGPLNTTLQINPTNIVLVSPFGLSAGPPALRPKGLTRTMLVGLICRVVFRGPREMSVRLPVTVAELRVCELRVESARMAGSVSAWSVRAWSVLEREGMGRLKAKG